MKKKLAWFAFFALLLLWGLSFLPGAVENEAESDFVNVVGKDVGIDAKQFIGPIKQHYGAYKWHHVDQDGDSLHVSIEIRFFRFNSISYGTSNPKKSIEDFPGFQATH